MKTRTTATILGSVLLALAACGTTAPAASTAPAGSALPAPMFWVATSRSARAAARAAFLA